MKMPDEPKHPFAMDVNEFIYMWKELINIIDTTKLLGEKASLDNIIALGQMYEWRQLRIAIEKQLGILQEDKNNGTSMVREAQKKALPPPHKCPYPLCEFENPNSDKMGEHFQWHLNQPQKQVTP